MKLNAPNVLLSKSQDIFDPVLIMQETKIFLKNALPLCCRLIMMIHDEFLFSRNSFHLRETRCNQSYRRHLLLQETKSRINSYV